MAKSKAKKEQKTASDESSSKEIATKPLLKRKKDLPSVDYLLKYGDPESGHEPATWKEQLGYASALLLVFCLSLFVFHNLIEMGGPRQAPYKIPDLEKRMKEREQMQQQQQQQHARVPNTETNTEL